MGSPAQPLLDLRSRLGEASRSFLDSHPADAVRELFGFEPQPVVPDPNKDPYIIEQQREALKSFQDAAKQKPALPQMTKPLSSK